MGQAILRYFGLFYLAVGLLDLVFHDARGYEFGFLNVNTAHSTIHALVGILWFAASFSRRWTRPIALLGVVLFALLVVAGIFPGLNPLEWWVPLDGAVLWFHVLTLAVLIAVVWTSPRAGSGVTAAGS